MSLKIKSGWSLFLVFWLCVLVFPVWAQEGKGTGSDLFIPDVVARVNGVDISSKQIKFELDRFLKNTRRQVDLPQKIEIVRRIIEKEVVRELIYQQGKGQKVQVDQTLVDENLESLKKPYSSEKEFAGALKERGISEADLRQSIEVDLMARKLLEKSLKGKVNIPDSAVKEYYEDNKNKFFRPESYKVSHIFVSGIPAGVSKTTPPPDLAGKKEEIKKKAREKIDKVLQEARSGADFSELAKKYSEDAASAQNGGELDFMYKGVFDPIFDEAVSKMKKGDISDVVETRYGYHIIKYIESRPGEQAPFTDMKESIQKYLFNEETKKTVQEYMEKLRKEAKIETFF